MIRRFSTALGATVAMASALLVVPSAMSQELTSPQTRVKIESVEHFVNADGVKCCLIEVVTARKGTIFLSSCADDPGGGFCAEFYGAALANVFADVAWEDIPSPFPGFPIHRPTSIKAPSKTK